MIFTAVVVIILLAAGIAEGVLHRRNIRRVPIRILVNGTRGKTSTARLIAASLNEAGIRTVCRTTGSEAVLVMPDGSTSPVIRKKGARITELIAFTRLCVKENAKAMVIECMALSEENQRTVADSLIQPTHVVFTNSYVDHVPEQGITEEQVAWTLARSIHKGSQVFCTEDYYRQYCEEKGIKYTEHTDFNEDIIADADILYMTRVQKERFSDLMEYERVKNVYVLNNDMLRKAKPNMKILHPLPRVNEIAYEVDDNPHAYYIQQAGNGLFAREAIFCDVLGISLDEVKNDKTIIK